MNISDSDCTGCPLDAGFDPSRRDFFRHATIAVGTLVTLGVPTTRAYPIPPADGVQIDRDNKAILVRWLNVVYAFSLSCPHQNTALTWLESDERFHCPKHRSEYSADGYFITGRATRGMDRYAIRRDGNTVVVDFAVLKKESDDADGWKAACVTLA